MWSCHTPVTRPNGYGNITGGNFVTRPRPHDPRTRQPARVAIPVIITSSDSLVKYLQDVPYYLFRKVWEQLDLQRAWGIPHRNSKPTRQDLWPRFSGHSHPHWCNNSRTYYWNTACIYIAHKFPKAINFVLPTETGRITPCLIYLIRTKRNITPRILSFLSTKHKEVFWWCLLSVPIHFWEGRPDGGPWLED